MKSSWVLKFFKMRLGPVREVVRLVGDLTVRSPVTKASLLLAALFNPSFKRTEAPSVSGPFLGLNLKPAM